MLAGDLNERHIGQRFKFCGGPEIDGTYEGTVSKSSGVTFIKVSNVTYDQHLHEAGFDANPGKWSEGYYISTNKPVIPLDKPVSNGYVKTKLAQYIRLEADKGGMVLNFAMADLMADIFMELMEGGTDANGEG